MNPVLRVSLKHSLFSVLSFLQFILYEISPDGDEEQLAAPSKEQLDEEKQLLLSLKPVMQKFLHDHTNLQVAALYALQVHCNGHSFPKGLCTPRVRSEWVNSSVSRDSNVPLVLQECCCDSLFIFMTWK